MKFIKLKKLDPSVLAVSCGAAFLNKPIYAADYLTQGMSLISKGLIAFGSVWTVWGIVVLAGGINEHNGQDIKQGMLRAVGGALIIAAAAWLTSIDFNFA